MIDSQTVGQNLVRLIFLGDYQSKGYTPFIDRIYGYYLREQFDIQSKWIANRLKELENYDQYPYQKVKQSLKLFDQVANDCYLMLCCEPSVMVAMMNKLYEIIGWIRECDQIISKRELVDQSEELLNRLTGFCDKMGIEIKVIS